MSNSTKDNEVDRRLVLKSTLASAGALLVGSAARAQVPAQAPAQATAPGATDAPGWPAEAFRQKTAQDALKSLYGKAAETSDKVALDAPEIAENGAVVPISVSTTMPNVTSIAILVQENPYTLAAMYKLPEGALPAVSNRLKMAKTTNVIAVVEADGKLYSAQKEVKVTVGGCGG